MITQTRPSLSISESERREIIEEYLKGGKTKVEIWRQYTGENGEHGQITRWMRQLGYAEKILPSRPLYLSIYFTKMKSHLSLISNNYYTICIFNLLLLQTLSLNISAQTLPEGFTAVQVVSGIIKPSAMAFTPDGRIFVAEQGGLVRVIKNGVLLPTPLIKVRVSAKGEGGLVGIAIDPNFTTNQYFYLYYTIPGNTRNRISRFKCNGDVASLSTENIVLNLDSLTAPIHHGGAMHFKDGKMFVSIGENANEANAQNLNTYHGKILRINADGSVPAGNPYTSGSEQKKRVWAYGLRNPFSFAIQPGTGRIFVNDVGFNAWEEINDATLAGRNFGWPEAEGNSTNPAFTNAVYAYIHGRNDEFGCAITGGTFFNPPQTNYPASYAGRYFFQDYCGQWIKTLSFSGTSVTVEPFANAIGTDALYLATGVDGNLYYLLRSIGSVYKIVYTDNPAPAILKQPNPISVSAGQSATFSVTASGRSPLSYQWQKNGVNVPGATSSVFTIPQTSAGDAGDYRVRVSNSVGSILSNTARLTITGANHLPVAQIITPAAGTLYRAGDVITFSGTATDDEDGDLPASAFIWFADFHHDTHHHDGSPVASGSKSGSFTIPTRGETSDNVWYRLYLIVTDSQGAKDTVFRDIHPRKSTITLTTQPAGLKINLDGHPMTSPISVVSVEKLERSIGAVSPQTFNEKNYVFEKWLHGGAETQTIATPLEDITYTVVYKETMQSNSIQRELWTGITGTSVTSIPVNTPPSSVSDLLNFEGPTNAGSDYGSRIRGYIHPPATGNYVFWISSDDKSELWLSADDNPSNKIKISSVIGATSIRQWNKYVTQQSAPISLVGGQRYYIEALHKEALGADHIAVGWQLPDGALERPIPGNRLSRYGSVNNPPIVSLQIPVNGQVYSAPANISISATASDADGSISKVEFYNGSVKLGEDASSPYSFVWNNISSGNYKLMARAIDHQGATNTSTVDISVTGLIQREVWNGITGTSVAAIPVNTSPSSISNLMILEATSNSGNDYGSRIRGYIHPPATGNYIFWISSDDQSELWLSNTDNPSQKTKLASVTGHTDVRQWSKYPSQQSAPVNLMTGRKYYIEVLHKEGTGVDHVAVGWQLPSGTLERPIAGARVSPFAGASPSPTMVMMSSTNVGETIQVLTDEVSEEIVLFPNPAREGMLTLTISGDKFFGDANEAIVQIADVTGHVIYNKNIVCDFNCSTISLNINQRLSAGVYTVIATVNQKSVARRLLVH